MKTIILSLLLYLPLTLFADNTKLEEHYNELGVNNLERIKKGLLNNGISEGQIDPVLRGMIRLIKSAKVDGKNFEMNPRMEIYFERRNCNASGNQKKPDELYRALKQTKHQQGS